MEYTNSVYFKRFSELSGVAKEHLVWLRECIRAHCGEKRTSVAGSVSRLVYSKPDIVRAIEINGIVCSIFIQHERYPLATDRDSVAILLALDDVRFAAATTLTS